MEIVEFNEKEGKLRIKVDNENDLWALYNVITPGDIVYSVTFRKTEGKGDKIRAEKVEKRRMFLGIKVEKVEYHEFTDSLRILGRIVEGPQDLGEYHTIIVSPGSDITIKKEHWTKTHRKIINQAVESTEKPDIVIASVEDDNITIALLYPYGLKEMGTARAKGVKEGGGARDGMYAEAYNIASSIIRDKKLPLLVVGPGFMKENFIQYIKEKYPWQEKFSTIMMDNTGSGGRSGIVEALKRGVVSKIISDYRNEIEEKMVEDVMVAIAKGLPVAYGTEEVIKALELGAAETVIMTNNYLRKKMYEDSTFLNRIEDLAMASAAKIEVISSLSDGGTKLDGIGGIAAKLRFSIDGG